MHPCVFTPADYIYWIAARAGRRMGAGLSARGQMVAIFGKKINAGEESDEGDWTCSGSLTSLNAQNIIELSQNLSCTRFQNR